MAKYHSGYLGPFDGKLGTAVGSRWKGIDYLRSSGRCRRGSQGVSELTAANITLPKCRRQINLFSVCNSIVL